MAPKETKPMIKTKKLLRNFYIRELKPSWNPATSAEICAFCLVILFKNKEHFENWLKVHSRTLSWNVPEWSRIIWFGMNVLYIHIFNQQNTTQQGCFILYLTIFNYRLSCCFSSLHTWHFWVLSRWFILKGSRQEMPCSFFQPKEPLLPSHPPCPCRIKLCLFVKHCIPLLLVWLWCSCNHCAAQHGSVMINQFMWIK